MRRVIAIAIAGSLTETTKMPCNSYSLPATACKQGMKLAEMEGSICSKCYGNNRGNYRFDVVKNAQANRLASLSHPEWVDAMVTLINSAGFFRWHDCGDVQNIAHFNNIVKVCERTPRTKHWMPTRERKIIESWIEQYGALPKNLVVRMSATWFDAPIEPIKGTTTTSGSHRYDTPLGHECPAPTQDGNCEDCRACWDKRVKHISYAYH